MKRSAIRAALTVAAVYGFFLIFAQFSFVELLRSRGASLTMERTVLAMMACAGIAGGFFAAARGPSPRMLKISMLVAALTAALAPVADAIPTAILTAITTGAALGVATVSLAALLPTWCGVAWVGLGTGIGYACCNLPSVFLQSPTRQAWIASGFALVGLLAAPSHADWHKPKQRSTFPLWGVVAIFTALVWLDSAAFFIIQHAPELKSATWNTDLLWRNATLHFALAGVGGLWLAKGGARTLPCVAWGLLAVASLAVNSESTRGLAAWFYPAGVSLYSAALVAWPGWFSGADGVRPAAWRAAWLFAVAGWFGSANGIAMAQSLKLVPPLFVAASVAIVVGVWVRSDRTLWRPALCVGALICLAAIFPNKVSPETKTAMENGRSVYISEGCLHCHSQYVRPDSPDELIWGPARTVQNVLKEKPVLIGNRRQGPDLTNVGARRSEPWMKIHFLKPQSLVPDSTMPSYAHLFQDERGNDLIKYLKESGVRTITKLIAQSSSWKPEASTITSDARNLFLSQCAPCHGPHGEGNGPLASHFARPPANLAHGPFNWTNAGDPLEWTVARVIKFGLPNLDMPGHETLRDTQILDLTKFVLDLRR